MSKVYITDYIENPDIEKEILAAQLSSRKHRDIEVLLVWHETVDRQYIDNLPKLKAIVRYGVGFDNVDALYAKSKGICVCNTPDYGTEEVSDTAIGMIMNIARAISWYDSRCKSYRDTWQEHIIPSVRRTSDQVVGIIGAGRIGGSVVLKSNALRFQTVIYDPYKERGHEKLLGTKRVDSLIELLEAADIITIHAPLTEETNGMVNDDFVRQMKHGASFVNTARGAIVTDIDIFYAPLKSGALSNIAMDVLPDEPPKSSKLINAWRQRESWLDGRIILNPHTAYYSQKAFHEMRSKAASNAKRILLGKEPFNIL